jgi:hypothetical protein
MENTSNIKGGALDHNLRCAANLEHIQGSCLSTDELKALAVTYNKAIDSGKTKGEKIKLVHDKEFLISELDNRFKNCKGKHLCWIKQKFIQDTKDFDPNDFFRPYGTDKKNDWLSDLNIDQVMTQVERKNNDYYFIGAVPIDFYEINYRGTGKFDFDDLLVNGRKDKNDMMFEYNLKKFYYKNILVVQEINKFRAKTDQKKKNLGKANFYEFLDFVEDIKNNDKQKLEKLINDFYDQFTNQNYDPEFIKSVKNSYPNFPNDFVNEIMDIKNKKYPIKVLGIVPNLDEHWKGGSHWVAMYANIETGQIYYFDSYGVRPNKRIRNFVKLIAEWKYQKDTGKKININSDEYMKGDNKPKNEVEQKYDIRYSQHRHQFKNSECGVYSMNFIIRLVNGIKFDDIIKQNIPDDTVNKCREIYFHNQDINSENFEIVETGKKLKIRKGKGYVCE